MQPTDPKFKLYSRAAYDQYEAAVAANDWPLAARIAVDGYLAVVAMEAGDREVAIEEVIPAVMRLDHDTMTLWLAEALRRLHNERFR